jgi:4-amino-4-deoxy-L-arabinose transferase-like glycosyltransferase
MGRKRERRKEAPAAPQIAVAAPPRVLPFLEHYSRLIAITAVIFASLRIVATYTVYNHTSDEPAHIACGLEWLDKGRYAWEPQHPPLARIATAVGPYLLGNHSEWGDRSKYISMSLEGIRILSSSHRYDLTLALARLGILPFFWIACWVVYEWGRRFYNRAVAAAAVLVFSFLPPILAHAGLATTDMAVTAFLGAAFLSLLMWMESATLVRAALFGLCSGLAIASKFSTLAFFPAAVAVTFIWYAVRSRPSIQSLLRSVRERAAGAAVAALVCFLVIWSIYRFSFGPVNFAHLRLPFPELYAGIQQVEDHNQHGHPSYLLGHRGTTGWWYFFPVVLAVKTPLAVLILLGIWLVWAFKRELGFENAWAPAAYSAGILLFAMSSRINIGLRHILPIYVGIALMSAVVLVRILEKKRGRVWWMRTAAVLTIWFAGASLLAHPDYLPYFNELALGQPEKIVADSDLDWGQDFKRLAARLKEVGAKEYTLATAYLGNFEQDYGLPPRLDQLDLVQPPAGWCAISISYWKNMRLGLLDRYAEYPLWPDNIPPTEHIGKGILLWYFPPGAVRR